jgi:hypothetical protein
MRDQDPSATIAEHGFNDTAVQGAKAVNLRQDLSFGCRENQPDLPYVPTLGVARQRHNRLIGEMEAELRRAESDLPRLRMSRASAARIAEVEEWLLSQRFEIERLQNMLNDPPALLAYWTGRNA